jgi:hypothetical protein
MSTEWGDRRPGAAWRAPPRLGGLQPLDTSDRSPSSSSTKSKATAARVALKSCLPSFVNSLFLPYALIKRHNSVIVAKCCSVRGVRSEVTKACDVITRFLHSHRAHLTHTNLDMWLLNTHTITLRCFGAKIPAYVILSHTWGQEEVTFDDISNPARRAKMKGFAKIVGCCKQAVQDGFEWAWIDTCCIDKRSSAELSEAINSMYKWYWNAAICYAYLQDVRDLPAPPIIGDSNWFRRGWTLQELLAPLQVEFYTQSWTFIGTKAGLTPTIQAITYIDETFLEDRTAIQYASIATKFCWASRRKTTREEDIAYCLLGLVGINMPLLYGEGQRAFHRLQLEILKQSNDHTILAWDYPVCYPFGYNFGRPSTAVLAPSPLYFIYSRDIQPIRAPRSTETLTFAVTNNGLEIRLPVVETDTNEFVAFLHCENRNGDIVGVRLSKLDNEQYHRPDSSLVDLSKYEDRPSKMRTLYLALENHADDNKPAPEKNLSCFLNNHVRGDCGYQVANIVLSTPTELANIDAYELAWKEFRVPSDALVCISIDYSVWSPNSIAILLRFSPGGHPIMYATEAIGEIDELLKIGWHRLCEGRSDPASAIGVDQLRVVLNNYGQRTLVEVKSKRRLRFQRQIWVFDVQIFKCVCSPWEYLDSEPPDCTCQIPPIQDNEGSGSNCFCTICRYLRYVELNKKEEESRKLPDEDNQEQHIMECVCPKCATESKIVFIRGPSTVKDLDQSGRFGNFHERHNTNTDCEMFAPHQIEDYKPCNPLHFVEYSCLHCCNESRVESVLSCNGTDCMSCVRCRGETDENTD